MGRGPLLRLSQNPKIPLTFTPKIDLGSLMRSYLGFPRVIPLQRAGHPRVTHPFATLLGLPKKSFLVRLACVRHAASVRPEPGSNSPLRIRTFSSWRTLTIGTDVLLIERSEIYVFMTHSSPKARTRTGRSACPLWARSNTLETSVFKQLWDAQ